MKHEKIFKKIETPLRSKAVTLTASLQDKELIMWSQDHIVSLAIKRILNRELS